MVSELVTVVPEPYCSLVQLEVSLLSLIFLGPAPLFLTYCMRCRFFILG